jgi:hypothetical protein
MQLNQKLGQKTESTTGNGATQMRISKDGKKQIFQMFTSSIYSNPIGTVVREITSNCFDSHIEAGVNTPVLVKHTHDKTDDTHHVSFIDFGVGMSPDRVQNVYGVYFESTKRDNNDEIGGFGIGGKTPLAYKRSTGHGEGEYDNSFWVITRYNGTEYVYNIVEGEESPEIHLMHKEPTTERNGTEVRVPVRYQDVSTFEREIIRQLYYFENLVFEGFSDTVTNDYKIIRGKTFLYRGDDLGNKMHVCLGKVAYPIDYDVLGLHESDYRIPVAINVPIGDIGVVASREQLDYSESTIKYLKKKLEDVKEELRQMLAKQYDNVTTLEDYFKVKNQFGVLYLSDTMSVRVGDIIKASEIDYSNFKFSFMKMPNDRQLLDLLFTVKVYGARETKGYSWRRKNNFEQLDRSYEGLQKVQNVYFSETSFEELTLKRIKQAYLRNEHGRFYVITPNPEFRKSKVDDIFNMEFDPASKDGISFSTSLFEMQNQYIDIFRKFGQEYEKVVVPESFVIESKKPKLSEELKKSSIPVSLMRQSKMRIELKHLVDFRGKIFYGTSDDQYKLAKAYRTFSAMFGEDHVADSYQSYRTGYDKFGKKKGIMFIQLAKNNIKYMEYCKNAMHIDKFYYDIMFRKQEAVINYFKNYSLIEKYNNLNSLYRVRGFEKINAKWAKKIEMVREFVDKLKDEKWSDLRYHKEYFTPYVDFDNVPETAEEKRVKKALVDIEKLEKDNEPMLQWVRTPSYATDTLHDNQIEIIKKVMSF